MEGKERVKILLASPIDPGAVEVLSESHDVAKPSAPTLPALKEAIVDRDAVVLRSGVILSADVLAAAPGLQLLVRAGAGLDPRDHDEGLGVLALHRGLEPTGLLPGRDQVALGLPLVEAVPLREQVVFDADGRHARAVEIDGGADDVAESAEAVVAVHHDRELGDSLDRTGHRGCLAHRHQVEVRQAVGHRRDAEPAHPHSVEVVVSDQSCAHRVVRADRHDGGVTGQTGAKPHPLGVGAAEAQVVR